MNGIIGGQREELTRCKNDIYCVDYIQREILDDEGYRNRCVEGELVFGG